MSAKIEIITLIEADGNAGGSVIQCTRCMASSAVHFDRKENLVGDWNRRSPALQAARIHAGDGWLSMDDAPNTGCQVLLYGHWRQFHGTEHESNHVNCGHYANGWVCEGRYNEFFIPVAWQPMPAPPAEAPQEPK